jgi:hypothetical protein
MRERQAGSALVAALVVSLAGVLIAHGALVLARAELESARASARVVRVEHAARAGVVRALEALAGVSASVSSPDGPPDPVRVSGRDGEARWEGQAWPVAPEIWWVEGEGREGVARRTRAVAAWRPDPAERARSLGAALLTGGASRVEGSERVTVGTPVTSLLPSEADGCTADSYGASEPMSAWRIDPDSAAPGLGPLAASTMSALADLRVGGTGTPAPLTLYGGCAESSWNWGDPVNVRGPCRGRIPLVVAESGTLLLGGTGQGVLVARGDLTLVDTRYFGLVLVEGALRLEGRARITGGVVARAGARIDALAGISGSRCWVEAVLRSPALRRPRVVAPVRWIRLDG